MARPPRFSMSSYCMILRSEDSSDSASGSSQGSTDEDDSNRRCKPHWKNYVHLIAGRGFRLDTIRDVREFYRLHPINRQPESCHCYSDASLTSDPEDLCRDQGLPENLFRGSRICDNKAVVVKAVHLASRELDITRFLSSWPRRTDPMNHCIPILDIIVAHSDKLAFIVMEEGFSLVHCNIPRTFRLLLSMLRQSIEHIAFMHKHSIAHLDISISNTLTDNRGHCVFIDFELSRRFENIGQPRIHGTRGTELPPELSSSSSTGCDPYKVDIYALGILLMRICKTTDYRVPRLMDVVHPMLNSDPFLRPPANEVLLSFDDVFGRQIS